MKLGGYPCLGFFYLARVRGPRITEDCGIHTRLYSRDWDCLEKLPYIDVEELDKVQSSPWFSTRVHEWCNKIKFLSGRLH